MCSFESEHKQPPTIAAHVLQWRRHVASELDVDTRTITKARIIRGDQETCVESSVCSTKQCRYRYECQQNDDDVGSLMMKLPHRPGLALVPCL